jgi:hypothetical protein
MQGIEIAAKLEAEDLLREFVADQAREIQILQDEVNRLKVHIPLTD